MMMIMIMINFFEEWLTGKRLISTRVVLRDSDDSEILIIANL